MGDLLRTVGPRLFPAFLAANFAPSTAAVYAQTAIHLFPWLRPLWRDSNDWLRQNAGRQRRRQATLATPSDIRRLVETLPSPMGSVVLLLWTSASRFGDIQHMRIANTLRTSSTSIFQVAMDTHKSDRYGRRRLTKWLEVPRSLEPRIFEGVHSTMSYGSTLRALQRVQPNLTMHSFRRGAATLLASRWEHSEISELTGHSTGMPTSSVFLYVEESHRQRRPSRQREMSLFLANAALSGASFSTSANACANHLREMSNSE